MVTPETQRGHYELRHSVRADGRQSPHRNDGGGRAGDNAADIAHYVVAKAGNLLCAAQKLQCFRRAGNLFRGHGVKGLFIRRHHGDADDIKENTDRNDQQQHNKCLDKSSSLQNTGGQKGDRRGNQDRNEKNRYDPSDIAILFRRLRLSFLSTSRFVIFRVQVNSSETA